jgi:hypothetical protein
MEDKPRLRRPGQHRSNDRRKTSDACCRQCAAACPVSVVSACFVRAYLGLRPKRSQRGACGDLTRQLELLQLGVHNMSRLLDIVKTCVAR